MGFAPVHLCQGFVSFFFFFLKERLLCIDQEMDS